MSERTRGYAHRVDVAADTPKVWQALITTPSLERWCSPRALMQPRAGGLFRASVDRITELEAHIDVFDPGRRLRLIYLPGAALPAAQTAIVDDFILEKTPRVTIVRLLGSGIPEGEAWDAYYRRMRVGWERAIARLKVFVEREALKSA